MPPAARLSPLLFRGMALKAVRMLRIRPFPFVMPFRRAKPVAAKMTLDTVRRVRIVMPIVAGMLQTACGK